MFGVKILLNAFALSLVICALILVWCENPDCDVTTTRCLTSLFIVMAAFTSRKIARL